MNTLKHRAGWYGAFFLVSVLCWYTTRTTPPTQPLDSHLLSSLPDQRITTLNVKQFDAAGMLIHQLTTPFMQHTPDQDKHWLKTPRITITTPNQPITNIQSQEATAWEGGTRITFQHDVIIHHSAYEKNQAGTLTTDEISYIPRQKLATTNADTKLDQGSTHIRAAHASTTSNTANQLILAIAQGDTTRQAHIWTTTSLKKPPLHAYADTIRYQPLKHRIELLGHAKLIQGSQSFSAPVIHYDTLHQHIITARNDHARTQIIIHTPSHS